VKLTWFTALLCITFFFLAYLPSLNTIPLRYDDDEGRRALVTAEMMISGDYVTPTINGEIYLNKPPLYNWIVSGWFRIFGDYSMLAFRIQVFLAITVMGYLVYRCTKKYTTPAIAFFTAFAYATNGRILIFDSFTGLIDTTFALTVYAMFMLTFYFGEKKKYWQLFLYTYLLTALGFLMKGMPALVFQALTLLAYFTWQKKFRILLGIRHIAGILLLVLICGVYYFVYFGRNELSPMELFSNLLNESSKRTPGHFGLLRTIKHLFTFPPEILYHYAPWTIFFIALFRRGVGAKIRENKFIFYSALVFLVNFPIYWLSPEVYPRYLFMFLPLMFSILFYIYFEHLQPSSWQHKIVYNFTVALCALLLLGVLVVPFSGLVEISSLKYVILLAILFGYLLWLVLKHKDLYLFVLLLTILVFRVGFGWLVMPERAKKHIVYRERAENIARISRNKPLYILKGSDIGNFDGMSFHIATLRGEVLKYRETIDTASFYIADGAQLKGKNYVRYLSFPNFYAPDSLRLVRFLSLQP
jgi:4-amino-4-deoxy-L-arabinose transferase-like glycosyltransferase